VGSDDGDMRSVVRSRAELTTAQPRGATPKHNE
jgi:hypothetical protein